MRRRFLKVHLGLHLLEKVTADLHRHKRLCFIGPGALLVAAHH